MIRGGKEFFDKDTWLLLDDIYPFDAATVLEDTLKKELSEEGRLSDLTVRQLMNCIRKIRDIEVGYKALILK
jgi:hypothetical protein